MPTRTRGGAGPKRRGTAFEHTVKGHLRKRGWPLVVRSYASKGPWDVMAARIPLDRDAFDNWNLSEVWLVQAKVGGYMPPKERVVLVDAALAVGATPVMATVVDRRVSYFLVTALTDRAAVLDPGLVQSSDTGVSDDAGTSRLDADGTTTAGDRTMDPGALD